MHTCEGSAYRLMEALAVSPRRPIKRSDVYAPPIAAANKLSLEESADCLRQPPDVSCAPTHPSLALTNSYRCWRCKGQDLAIRLGEFTFG